MSSPDITELSNVLYEYYMVNKCLTRFLDNGIKLMEENKPCEASKELKKAYIILVALEKIREDRERQKLIKEVKDNILILDAECLFDVHDIDKITGKEICNKLSSLYITSTIIDDAHLREKITAICNKYCKEAEKHRKELLKQVTDILHYINEQTS